MQNDKVSLSADKIATAFGLAMTKTVDCKNGYCIFGENIPNQILAEVKKNNLKYHVIKNTETGSLYLPAFIEFAEENTVAVVFTPVLGLSQVVVLSQKYNFKIVVTKNKNDEFENNDSHWIDYADGVVDLSCLDG